MRRQRFILTTIGLAALACAAVAGWWWIGAERTTYYTDGSDFRASADDAPVRDILWRTPEPMRTVAGEPLTGAGATVSADGDTLLLSRVSDLGDLDLFIAGRTGNAWTQPRPLAELNTIDNELAPALSADGHRLYFASDRPGGQGGLDIWISTRDGDHWTEPTPLACNAQSNETDPHPFTIDGVETILFSSDRPREDAPLSMDLYLAALDQASPRHLVELSSPANDLAPVATPLGDFIYFASNREGGAGGLDLYRSRLRIDPDLGPVFDSPRSLGPSVNTAGDDTDPSLGMEGFALHFSTVVDGTPGLKRAVSREVFLARSTTRGDLLSLLPWILLALAIVLLLSMLHRTVRDEAWRARIATLGLMAKCALASLVVHAGIMALLAALHVPPTAGQPSDAPGVQVALSSSSVRSSIASQMRGASSTATVERAQAAPQAPAISNAPSPSTTTFQALTTPAPSGGRLTPVETSQDSSIAPAPTFADAPASSIDATLPQPTLDTPSVALPSVATAQSPTQPEATIPGPSRAEPSHTLGGPQLADAGSAATTVAQLAPATTKLGDDAAFIDAVSRPEASGPPRDSTLAGDTTLPSIPEAALPGPQLAMPSTSPASDTFAEVGLDSPSLAQSGATAPPFESIDGSTAVEAIELDALDLPVGLDTVTRAHESQDASPTLSTPEAPPLLDTPTLALATPQLALPQTLLPKYELLGIVVDDRTGEPIARAQVRLDLEGADDLTGRSADDGTFALGFDQIPDNAALTATSDGYMPGAINIAQRDLRLERRVVVRLTPIDPHVIVMEAEPEVHHLGNDEFSGRINSQFQRRSEGLKLQIPFEMTRDHAALPLRGAELRLFVKGTQAQNPVRINGERIATLALSPDDGSFGEQAMTIPAGVLRLGRNVLEIESVARRGSDFDDFEFVNPRVVLLVREEPQSLDVID